MSEEATPAPAEAAPAEGQAKPAKSAQAPVWMLALVVVLALGAGSALGAFLIAPPLVKARQASALAARDPAAKKAKKAKKKDNKHEGKEGGGKSESYKLENIVVNPADSQGQRFLMCSLAIEADDPKALDVLREHEVQVRDRVVTALTSLTMAQLTSAGARDSIRATLARTIHPVLGEDGEDVELKIYLPSFVIQ